MKKKFQIKKIKVKVITEKENKNIDEIFSDTGIRKIKLKDILSQKKIYKLLNK